MTSPHAKPDVQLLCSGVALFPALIQAMSQAQHEVLLETYIFDFDGAGEDVARALIATA
jgi:cardiolipin synthase